MKKYILLMLILSGCVSSNSIVTLPSIKPNDKPQIQEIINSNVEDKALNIKGNFVIHTRDKNISIDSEYNIYRSNLNDLNIDENGNGYLVSADGYLQKIESYKFTDTKLIYSDKYVNKLPIVNLNKYEKGIITFALPSIYQKIQDSNTIISRNYGFYYIIDNFKIVKKIEKTPIFDYTLIDENGDGMAYKKDYVYDKYSMLIPSRIERVNIVNRKIINYELSDKDIIEISDNKYRSSFVFNNKKALEFSISSSNFLIAKLFIKIIDNTIINNKFNDISDFIKPLVDLIGLPNNSDSTVNSSYIDLDGNGFVVFNSDDAFIIPIENYQLKNSSLRLTDRSKNKAYESTYVNSVNIDKSGNGIVIITNKKYNPNASSIDEYNQYYQKIINYKLQDKKYILPDKEIMGQIKISSLNENGDGILIISANDKTYGRYIKNYELQ